MIGREVCSLSPGSVGIISTTPALAGIHHITAISGDPQSTIDFYMDLLGLRLIKKTVNFDDPSTYHLYYGDGLGRPGTIMTTFTWPGTVPGRAGSGEVGVTAFSVPFGTFPFWKRRLEDAGVQTHDGGERYGDRVLAFADRDGMPLELIASSALDDRPGWQEGPVGPTQAIRGLHAPTLYVSRLEPSDALLTSVLGFRHMGADGDRVRYAVASGAPGSLVDLVVTPHLRGRGGAGTVHHIAWSTPDDDAQLTWQARLQSKGVAVTEVRDRHYFHSIYFREPGGVLYEIATDSPGFAIDESPESLGTSLKLPAWLEGHRERIERSLPPVRLPHIDQPQGATR